MFMPVWNLKVGKCNFRTSESDLRQVEQDIWKERGREEARGEKIDLCKLTCAIIGASFCVI